MTIIMRPKETKAVPLVHGLTPPLVVEIVLVGPHLTNRVHDLRGEVDAAVGTRQ
jgi:hypothetical protein